MGVEERENHTNNVPFLNEHNPLNALLPAGPCEPSRSQVLRITFHVSIIPNRISRTIVTHGITPYIFPLFPAKLQPQNSWVYLQGTDKDYHLPN